MVAVSPAVQPTVDLVRVQVVEPVAGESLGVAQLRHQGPAAKTVPIQVKSGGSRKHRLFKVSVVEAAGVPVVLEEATQVAGAALVVG
jgi:hypothetical protein